jgi:hypothetical protein
MGLYNFTQNTVIQRNLHAKVIYVFVNIDFYGRSYVTTRFVLSYEGL